MPAFLWLVQDKACGMSGLSEFPLGSVIGRHVRGDARHLPPHYIKKGDWLRGSTDSEEDCPLLSSAVHLHGPPCTVFCLDESGEWSSLCGHSFGSVSLLPSVSHSIPGWVLHVEPRQRNFLLYTGGVNQHFGKCNYRLASSGNLWVSHTWSAWSSSMSQLFH